jgi:hypothetical protein
MPILPRTPNAKDEFHAESCPRFELGGKSKNPGAHRLRAGM